MRRACTFRSTSPHQVQGFTLIELLAAIALLAILTSIAVPSFVSISRQYRLDAVTEEFMASVQLARVEAIRLGQDVLVQRQADCDSVPSTKTAWRCGWVVFADLNQNRQLDGSDTFLQSVPMTPGVTFQKIGGGSPYYLRIDHFGRSAALGQRYEVFPAGGNVEDGQLICFSTGTRVRTVKRAKACPPLPGESA